MAVVSNSVDELARRWTPILNEFREHGVDLCYEIHPSEDLFDGADAKAPPDRAGDSKSALGNKRLFCGVTKPVWNGRVEGRPTNACSTLE